MVVKKEKEKKKNTIEWEKPSGIKVVTNDEVETVKAAEALGWKRLD